MITYDTFVQNHPPVLPLVNDRAKYCCGEIACVDKCKGWYILGGGDVRGHVRTHDQFQYERLRFLSAARRSGGRRIRFHLSFHLQSFLVLWKLYQEWQQLLIVGESNTVWKMRQLQYSHALLLFIRTQESGFGEKASSTVQMFWSLILVKHN